MSSVARTRYVAMFSSAVVSFSLFCQRNCAELQETMKDVSRRFNVYCRADPVTETLLGPVSEWQPMGCIAYTRPAGPIVGLTRFPISDDLR